MKAGGGVGAINNGAHIGLLKALLGVSWGHMFVCIRKVHHSFHCALLGKVGYKVANNCELSPPSSEDDTDGACMCCTMTKLCKCGIEADVRESNDNYRRRYMRCPKRVSPIKLFVSGTLQPSVTVFHVLIKSHFVGRCSM